MEGLHATGEAGQACGGGQLRHRGLRQCRVTQRSLAGPLAERGDQLQVVSAFGIAVVPGLADVLAGEQPEGGGGGAQFAVGAGELSLVGSQQGLLRIGRGQHGHERRQPVVER